MNSDYAEDRFGNDDPTGYGMIGLQYSIHRPSAYINQHRSDLLPDWQVPVSSMMLVLQPCSVALNQTTPDTEQQKQFLRRRFLHLSKRLIISLKEEGYAADRFDPRTGRPYYSRSGPLTLDDVAVVKALLGYRLIPAGACHLIEHPTWGCGVFPSVVVSSAPTEVLGAIADQVWHSRKLIIKPLDPASVSDKGLRTLH
jgi:Methylmalonic aciduria and homocystinuria type D protein